MARLVEERASQMKSIELTLPLSILINGRRCFKRSEIEHMKRCMMARAMGSAEPEYCQPDTEYFVNAAQVSRELGIARRTMARRIRETEERDKTSADVGKNTSCAA